MSNSPMSWQRLCLPSTHPDGFSGDVPPGPRSHRGIDTGCLDRRALEADLHGAYAEQAISVVVAPDSGTKIANEQD